MPRRETGIPANGGRLIPLRAGTQPVKTTSIGLNGLGRLPYFLCLLNLTGGAHKYEATKAFRRSQEARPFMLRSWEGLAALPQPSQKAEHMSRALASEYEPITETPWPF